MKDYPLIDRIGNFDAAILADGDFPSAPQPLSLLRRAPFVVCCDGAARHCPAADVIIGDGDSVPAELRNRLVRIAEQADNDLTKATRYCLARGMRRIVYLGATGRREDHTLGNISLLARYAVEMDAQPLMATDYGWFVPVRGNAVLGSFKGQQVSLFNLTCQTLVATGLRWPATTGRQWWQGTLNEALGASFGIEADGCCLVYRTYL